ncbi:MBL fold metallo-hydrolase [Enhygromyxa salina]|uniref:Beta-lactamase n=1 Tax=Enhygromyxa salina TaxID=215803 RepID=A0A2S9YM05_9BACT|nr:MBL fold metallo-hydrolase [Enhygromyxa salina]PRQ06120.1 Beta-lactamase precursor [Enhygromyxa salina]
MNTQLRTILPSLLLLAACTEPGSGLDSDTTSESGDTAAETQEFTACDDEFTITDANPMYAWTPNAITLESHELSPGVFVIHDANANTYAPAGIPLATSGGFVIGDDGVLLVETMVNRQLFCQVIDLVREQTDKPVLYAINTSFHGDHSFGNAYLPDEVQVVQHERTADHIAAHFDEDIAFMENGFGADQGIAEATPVAADVRVTDDGWSVDLGGVVVEAQYHGFGQTHGDLFVHVPSAKVLWTGNPLIAEAPALPWLLEGQAQAVSATLAAVKASVPADTTIIPGHSHPLGLADFDFSIDYLDTLVDEVQTAVDAGLTVEETVAAVSMEPFQGYALWDWIHSGVNVPTTHAELGG